MILRQYDAEKDREALIQVWHEVGWIDKSEEKELEGFDRWFTGCRLGVAEVDGRVECGVTTHEGTLTYLDEELSMCAVSGVATSFVGRKRGLAVGHVDAALIMPATFHEVQQQVSPIAFDRHGAFQGQVTDPVKPGALRRRFRQALTR